MAKHAIQADLFGAPEPMQDSILDVPPDFIEDRLRELVAMVERVEAADRLPWPDQAQAWVAEMRFDGLLAWLPQGEAAALRARFDAGLDRLYAVAAKTNAGS